MGGEWGKREWGESGERVGGESGGSEGRVRGEWGEKVKGEWGELVVALLVISLCDWISRTPEGTDLLIPHV